MTWRRLPQMEPNVLDVLQQMYALRPAPAPSDPFEAIAVPRGEDQAQRRAPGANWKTLTDERAVALEPSSATSIMTLVVTCRVRGVVLGR